MHDQLASVLLLIEAAFLGGLIGIERERSNQPAGVRTHLILCLGSALIMIVSRRVAEGGVFDPGRIAAQVVTGVGFLGAGAILRMGPTVRGLTTAASIWTTAGIGLAVGAGYHTEAVAAVAIMLLSLGFLKKFSRQISGKLRFRVVEVTVTESGGDNHIHDLEDLISRERCQVREVDVTRDLNAGQVRVRVQIGIPRDFDPAQIADAIMKEPWATHAEVR
ncbi:MAG: MgtC/SapB family protein [bacterium]|nr:MgtC/SapB family protein [bacterium]